MDVLPEILEELTARLDALENRVRALERGEVSPQRAEVSAAPGASPTVAEIPVAGLPAAPAPLPLSEQTSGAFLLLGKSMLGIAGAYLLRALAETGVLAPVLIAALAIAYAIAWQVAASRTPSRAPLAPVLYAGTSALILAPMLWELTTRFHVLTPFLSAAVLGMFVAAGTGLSWKKGATADFAVTYGAAAVTALALSVATHEMVAFFGLLLAMDAFCEYRGASRPGVRILVAAAADLAAWFLIVVYRVPANSRADYAELGPAILVIPSMLLFAITMTSVSVKTMVLKRRMGVFETVQCAAAFLLALWSGLLFVPHFSTRVAGAICLLLAGGCYAAAYGCFRRQQELRNFRVFVLWSAALLVSGIFMSLPVEWAVAGLALASMASAVVAGRIGCITLETHGIVYLGAAAIASGLIGYSVKALAGAIPATAEWSVFLVSATALVCYAAARENTGEKWRLQALHLFPALVAAIAMAALAAQGAVRILALRLIPAPFHVAFVRTLTVCALALGLTFGGARWGRLELKRIAYAALAFLAIKLLAEDLRHGSMAFSAGSICLFALTLIAVPRGAGRRAQIGALGGRVFCPCRTILLRSSK